MVSHMSDHITNKSCITSWDHTLCSFPIYFVQSALLGTNMFDLNFILSSSYIGWK
jgi:hypothetical protein